AGKELWVSDGTNTGTTRLAEMAAGTASKSPAGLTRVGNLLFFQAQNASSADVELFKIDPAAGNAISLVNDITPGTGASNPGNLTDVNGIAYFTATDGTNGIELWKSDGTGPGTMPVANINPTGDASPRNLKVVNDPPFLRLYFTATDGVYGEELY